MIDINKFSQELVCKFKDRTYSVRDNGSVYRHQKEGSRPAPLDNKWTFGKKDAVTGYMMLAGVRVHQIVATAFHGVPEYPTMVVDHIDTNRCNNRPENLRWLTRLENVLNNPYTRSRIAFLLRFSRSLPERSIYFKTNCIRTKYILDAHRFRRRSCKMS